VSCSVLQCVAVWQCIGSRVVQFIVVAMPAGSSMLRCVAVCNSVFQCVSVPAGSRVDRNISLFQ